MNKMSKNLKSLFLMLVVCQFFSCTKNVENTPKNFSPEESRSFMTDESEKLEQIIDDFKVETKDAYLANNSLRQFYSYDSNESVNSLPYDFIPTDIGGIAGFNNMDAARVNFQNSIIINPLKLLEKKNNIGKSIPLDFDKAKGVWEVKLVVTNTYPGSRVEYCSDYDYSTGTYTYKYLSFKYVSNVGNEIVLKFPSKIYRQSSEICELDTVINDLEYTINELEYLQSKSYSCSNNVITEYFTDYVIKIKSSIKKDENEILNYEMNKFSNGFKYISKTNKYSEEIVYDNSNKTNFNYSSTLKYGDKVIFMTQRNTEYSNVDYFEEYFCKENNFNYYGEYVLRQNLTTNFGDNINIKGSIDYAKALEYVKLKNLKYSSSTSSTEIENYINKFVKFEVFNNSGSKIGNIKIDIYQNSSSYYSYPYNIVIEYNDGDRELITNYSQSFRNLISIYGLLDMLN